jgi:hypothetical protein
MQNHASWLFPQAPPKQGKAQLRFWETSDVGFEHQSIFASYALGSTAFDLIC